MGGGVQSLVWDGSNVYASCENGHVYRYDDGVAWSDAGCPSRTNDPVYCLAWNGTNIYAGCQDGHIYRHDGGTTWKDVGSPSPLDYSVDNLVWNGARLYASDAIDVYFYEGGTTWTDVGNPGQMSHIEDLVWNGNRLYAGRNDGHVLRYDGDTTWTDVWPTGAPSRIACLAWDGTNIYAGCLNDVYRYDGGSNWTHVGSLGGFGFISSMVWNGTNLYASCFPGNQYSESHVYRYDGGTTWTDTGSTGHLYVESLVWDGTNIYAGSWDGFVYRYDGGTTWTDTGDKGGSNVETLAWNGTHLFAGGTNGHVYRYGGGTTWVDTGRPEGSSYVTSLVWDGSNLYAGSNKGHVYRYDGGTTWTDAGGPGGSTWINCLAWTGTSLYAGCNDDHVYRYDGGTTWTDAGSPGSPTWVDWLAWSGTDLYAACSSHVYRYDGGTKWTDTGSPTWNNDPVEGLVWNDTSLYTCHLNGEVFRYDGGTTWTDALFAPKSCCLESLVWSGTNLYAGGENGVFRFANPAIFSVEPEYGPPGTRVTVNGDGFGNSREATGRNATTASYVTFNGVKATQYVSWSDTEIVVIVPYGARTGPVRVTTATGSSNTDHDFTVEKQFGSQAWLVAEGSTGGGFDTFILIQNPNTVPADAAVAFATESGIAEGTILTVPPESRSTLRLSDYMPDEWSVSTLVASETPIVVERSTYWDKTADPNTYPYGPEPYEMMSGHANPGFPEPYLSQGTHLEADSRRETDHYFPEGSTAGFDTWILIFNPNEAQAQAEVTLMDENGPVVTEDVTIGAMARKTVHLNEIIPDANHVATRVTSSDFLIAERSMYWDPDASNKAPDQMIGGHSTSGSPGVSNSWYVADGATAGGFETFILLQNPNDQQATVTAIFSDATGVVEQLDITMPAQSRSTIRLSDYIPDNYEVSTTITSDQAIVAERSMYWDKRETSEPSSMKDGHSCIGETDTSRAWMVAEGSTAGGFDTFVLITNTEDYEAFAAITFMTEDGPNEPFFITVPARSRYTLWVNEYLPDEFQVSTLITSGSELVVERSMYWDNRAISPEGDFPARPYECIGGHSASGIDP